MRVREGCAVSNRGDRQVGRKQVGSHPDAVLDVQASLARQRNVREYADAEDNELCGEASSVCRLHVINCSIAAMNAPMTASGAAVAAVAKSAVAPSAWLIHQVYLTVNDCLKLK